MVSGPLLSRRYSTRHMIMADYNPTPAEDRGSVVVSIGVGERDANGRYDKIDVSAKETVSPFLVVNPCPILGPNGTCNVTHVQTGFAMMQGIPDERTAELCAGAISRIFDFKIESDQRDYLRRFNMLPPKLQNWIKNWRKL
jgi:hypothetical protein